MTPVRSLLIATVALALLIGARPMAGDGQFPRGLMSAAPTKAKACAIETTPLSFGTYDPLAATALSAVATVTYICGNVEEPERGGGIKNIRIEMTTGASGQYGMRRMYAGAVDYLEYNIYLDSTHRSIWGNGVNSEFYFDAKPPNKTPVTVPAYGQIHGYQDVPAGQYVDALTVRIVF